MCGLGSPRAFRDTKEFLRSSKAQLVFLSETRSDNAKIKPLMHAVNMDNCHSVFISNMAGGLCLIWSKDIDFTILSSTKNYIDSIILEE